MKRKKQIVEDVGSVSVRDVEPWHCRWPCGDPLDRENFKFCGREVVPTTSWCIVHLKRVTPQAKAIINRELMKWDERGKGIVPEPVIAAKMTEKECLSHDKDRQREVDEEMR